MSSLKTRLETDMKDALKSRDELILNTLRMVLTAVRTAESAGKQQRDLTDEEVLKVLAKQAKQREESAEAFDAAGRTDSARRERAEQEILNRYLPKTLSPEELTALVDEVFTAEGFTEPKQMGQAMKAVQAKVAGRADGKAVAAIVKARLAGLYSTPMG